MRRMLLENPKHERNRDELMQRPAMQDEARQLAQFYRASERQSRFGADVAAALVRILKDETRGIARSD
jgi:hypothetical protein